MPAHFWGSEWLGDHGNFAMTAKRLASKRSTISPERCDAVATGRPEVKQLSYFDYSAAFWLRRPRASRAIV
jgi:hypothetical protein